MLLLAAALVAQSTPESALPSGLAALAASSPFAALALWVIHRLWKERDEERAAWAKERERERVDTERLLSAVIAATLATDRQTSLMERVEILLK